MWGTARVLLLGDAAHGMTPNQGQGAAMAIEDAVALANALAGGVEGALERYVRARQRRVRAIQLSSRRLGAMAQLESRGLCWARDAVMRLLPGFASEAQYRRLVEPGLALTLPPGEAPRGCL